MPRTFKAPNGTNPYSAGWRYKLIKRSGDDLALCSAPTDPWLGVVVSVSDKLGGEIGVALAGELAELDIGTTIDVSTTDLISPDANGRGQPRTSPNRAAAQLVQQGDAAAGNRATVRVLGLQETTGGDDVSYTPDDTNDWPGGDPDDLAEAVDTLADRVIAREADLVITPGAPTAEVADARSVTITCADSNGVAVAAAQVFIELLSGDATPAVAANQAFDLTTGTANTTDTPASNVSMLATADAGSLVVSITDKSAALVGSMWLKLTPAGRRGAVKFVEVAFT